MANRFSSRNQSCIVKSQVELYAAFSVAENGTPTLLKWNYPVFGGGPIARTYTAANTVETGPNPQYTVGAEGVRSVVKTATGLWTVTLQDNYQRLIGLRGFTRLAGGAGTIMQIAENSTISNFNTTPPATSIVGVALLSATATLANPQLTETVFLTFTLADASEP